MGEFDVRLTTEARDDLERLNDHWLAIDLDVAQRARDTIAHALATLKRTPFTCRKAGAGHNSFLRELIISFGSTGYVALFEIDSAQFVTVLAVRHQREQDYH